MRRNYDGLEEDELNYARDDVVEPPRLPKPFGRRGYSNELENLVYACLLKEPNGRPKLTGRNNLLIRIRRNINRLKMDMRQWRRQPPNMQDSQQGNYQYKLHLPPERYALGTTMPPNAQAS